MRNNYELRKLLNDTFAAITDKELFCSTGYQQILSNFAAATTGRYKKPLAIKVVWETKGKLSANTDGKQIKIGVNWRALHKLERSKRHLGVIGLLSHELGHCIGTDFVELDRVLDGASKGWYPYPPETVGKEDQKRLDDISESFQKVPATRRLYQSVLKELLNYLEDPFVDRLMSIKFPGICRTGINFKQALIFEALLPIEKKVNQQGAKEFEIFFDALLSLAFFGAIKSDEKTKCRSAEAEQLKKDIIEKLDCLKTIILQARTSHDFRERVAASNLLFVKMWPYLNDYVIQDTEKDSVSELSESELERKIADLEKFVENSLIPPMPIGSGKPEKLSTEEIDAFIGALNESKMGPPIFTDQLSMCEGNGGISYSNYEASPSNMDFQRLIHQIAEEKTDGILEHELAEDLSSFVSGINFPSIHKGKEILIKRMKKVPDHLRLQYALIKPEITSTSKILQEAVREIFREKKDGTKLTSLVMGNRIMSSSLYRQDCRCFYNYKLPTDSPKLAVGLLIDESGSMGSYSRSEYALRTALVLHHFCLSLSIPIMIVGHTEQDKGIKAVELYDYADVDKPSWENQIRLMDIQARKNNRDGAALRFMGEKLRKRPEEIKLLIVISDGSPNAAGYSGKPAKNDIQEIHKELVQRGVIVFAAAIGDDKESIRACYGDKAFLNIGNLQQLPKRLTDLLRQFIK